MHDQTAESVEEALMIGWIHRHGIPKVLLTDQGRNVDGKAIRELCSKFGIVKKRSSPYHPAGDGEAERAIQSVKQALWCQLAEHRSEKTEWPRVLQQASFVHNSLRNASTKFTPHELMYGTKLRSLIDVAAEANQEDNDKRKPVTSGGCDTVPTHPAELWEQAETNTRQAKEAYKSFHDRRTALTPTVVEVGESVYRKNCTREDGLDPMYQGPYRVVDFRHPNVKIEGERGRTTWLHLDECKVMPSGTVEHWIAPTQVSIREATESREGQRQPDPRAIEPVVRDQRRNEEVTLRKSTRAKKKPERFESD